MVNVADSFISPSCPTANVQRRRGQDDRAAPHPRGSADASDGGDPVHLEAMGMPLVGGIKHLPVRFTPTATVGAGA
jgi:hypothetical protein